MNKCRNTKNIRMNSQMEKKLNKIKEDNEKLKIKQKMIHLKKNN